MLRNWRAAVFWLLYSAIPVVSQDSILEDRLKATFIYNFIQFSEWPRQAFSTMAPFTICVVGDTFKPIMEDTVRGEAINGRPVSVRSVATTEAIGGCQVMYFREKADSSVSAALLKAASGGPVLTIGESPDFIRQGGIIRFTKIGNRIRFEINPKAAEARSLLLSSRLLRLADIVEAR